MTSRLGTGKSFTFFTVWGEEGGGKKYCRWGFFEWRNMYVEDFVGGGGGNGVNGWVHFTGIYLSIGSTADENLI